MEAASKIIFDEEEDLYVQAVALQTYLLSLEAQSVNLGAMSAAKITDYTLTNGIIDSVASATFVTLANKIRNATKHKAKLQTANGQSCYKSHAGQQRYLSTTTHYIYQH